MSGEDNDEQCCSRDSCVIGILIFSFFSIFFLFFIVFHTDIKIETKGMLNNQNSSKFHSDFFKSEEERIKNIEKCINEFLIDEAPEYYYSKIGRVILIMNIIALILVFFLFIYSIVYSCKKCCKTDKMPYHWSICIICLYGTLELLISVILVDNKKCNCESCELYLKFENLISLNYCGIISMIMLFVQFILSIIIYIKSRNKKENTDKPKNMIIIDNKKITPNTVTNNTNQYNKLTLPVRQINIQINNNNFQTVKGNAFMINPENVPNSELPDINEINEINKINDINEINKINSINDINNNVAPPPLPSNEPFNEK